MPTQAIMPVISATHATHPNVRTCALCSLKPPAERGLGCVSTFGMFKKTSAASRAPTPLARLV